MISLPDNFQIVDNSGMPTTPAQNEVQSFGPLYKPQTLNRKPCHSHALISLGCIVVSFQALGRQSAVIGIRGHVGQYIVAFRVSGRNLGPRLKMHIG